MTTLARYITAEVEEIALTLGPVAMGLEGEEREGLLRRLIFRDAEGRFWHAEPGTGRWLRHEDGAWHVAQLAGRVNNGRPQQGAGNINADEMFCCLFDWDGHLDGLSKEVVKRQRSHRQNLANGLEGCQTMLSPCRMQSSRNDGCQIAR